LHGYPNVGNYDDAIKTLEYSDLKFLVLENFLIEKI
jgi:predicted NodU family carbamoyl transferase